MIKKLLVKIGNRRASIVGVIEGVTNDYKDGAITETEYEKLKARFEAYINALDDVIGMKKKKKKEEEK